MDNKNTLHIRTKLSFVFWSLFLSIIVRYPYFVTKDPFPLGDGGLFVVMINAIKSNHYWLPETVSYNSSQIPFAYPPLGFYLTILASKLTGMSTLWVMRFLPIAFNLLTVVSVAFLSSEVVKDRVELFISTTIFPIVFQSYEWLIKGGGCTRSPSMFFMTLTLLFLVLHQKRGKFYYLILVIISLSAAVMSHAEWGMIAVASIFAYLVSYDIKNWRKHISLFIKVGVFSLILTAPWYLTVMSKFGVTPFLAASQSIASHNFFSHLFDGSIFAVTVTLYDSYFIPTLVGVGVIVSLLRRDFFFLIWPLFIYIVNSRNSPKNEVIPLALLAAIGLRGIDQLISHLFSLLQKNDGQSTVWQRAAVRFSFSYIYIIVLLFVILTKWEYKPLIRPISQIDRNAMQFVKENTAENARFIVLTPYDWFISDTAEWFPYLSGRHSLTTPQGLEWISSREFRKITLITHETSILVQNELIDGGNRNVLRKYIEIQFPDFDYVAIFAKKIDVDFGGFLASGKYKTFYRKNDVLIFSVLGK